MSFKLDPELVTALQNLYADMEQAYNSTAQEIPLTCDGCPDNCCDSHFTHHTYLEWAYLWHGMHELPVAKQKEIVERARNYERQSQQALGRGERPKAMCPLNEKGRCILYQFRLMVCRTHGVPARLTRPDGRVLEFPGCFRCQNIVEQRPHPDAVPRMERTRLLQRLVMLEQRFMDNKRHLAPRLDCTIAQMLIKGPPSLPQYCGK